MLVPCLVALALSADPPPTRPVMTLPGEALGARAGVTGQVRVHHAMKSAQPNGLLPRDVFVWLPTGYTNVLNADQRYPVLYMHDGQNAFDPSTAFLGREWHADEVVHEMLRQGQIPPIIIVAIANTPERVADYTPDQDPDEKRGDSKPQGVGGQGARYVDWIANELKPFIDANYRTQRGPESTAMLGSSLGGIISLAAAERHPQVFGCIAAVSPSLWWNGGSVIERWKSKPPAVKRLWIDMGDRERAGLVDALRRFQAATQGAYGPSMHVEVIPGGRHDEPSWSTRFARTLRFLFGERDWQRVDPPEPVPPPEPASARPSAPASAAPPAAPK
jgi:predicted alpha/beta superfamily hydrolase